MEGLAYFGVFFGIMLLSMFLRQLVSISVFLSSVLALMLFISPEQLNVIPSIAFTSTYSWEVTSLPLFVMMGLLMMHTGISRRLFNGLAPLCSYLPGGLQQLNILFSAVFAAMTGSGSSGIATLAGVAVPEFERRPQYRMGNVFGSMCGGAVLSTTIPPSVPLIIYGALVGESIGSLFIAAVIPGLIEGGTQMAYIAIESLVKREGQLEKRAPPLKAIFSLLQAWPVTIIIGMALVTIYTGIATPTEAGALGTFGAAMVGIMDRQLTWNKLVNASAQTLLITGMFGLSFIGARVYSFAASSLYLPQLITNWFIQSGMGIVGLLVMYLILGFILGLAAGSNIMVFVITPILYPIFQESAAQYGWNGLWLGVTLVLLLDQGSLSPPIGIGAFILSAMTKRTNEYIFKGIWPYMWMVWFSIIIITIWPQLVTWLPSTMLKPGGG